MPVVNVFEGSFLIKDDPPNDVLWKLLGIGDKFLEEPIAILTL